MNNRLSIFRFRKRGNALSEYGILIGLLAVVSVSALTMLGNSNSQLLGKLNQEAASPALQNMMQLNFGASGQSNANGPGVNGQNGGTSLGDSILSNGTGGGVNATSIEGQKRELAYNAINYGNELQAIADSLPPGSDLRGWLTMDIIPRMRSLAAVEGYAANIATLRNNIEGSYDDEKALADLEEIRNQLVHRTRDFSYAPPEAGGRAVAVYPDPELKATVVGLLNQAIEGTRTFGVTSEPGPFTWNIELAKAYDSRTTSTALVNEPYSQSHGYLTIVDTIQQAQANRTIDQNIETATTARDADHLEDTAEGTQPD